MADWQNVFVLMFAIIMSINIGLVSVDASGTLPESVLGDSNYVNFDYEDLNRQFFGMAERTQTGATSCDPSDLWCTTVGFAGEVISTLTVAANLVVSIVFFITDNWYGLIFGYWLALNNIADMLEPTGIAIHTMFTVLSATIFLISMLAFLVVIRSVWSAFRGGG